MNKIQRIFSIPLWIGEVENNNAINESLLDIAISKKDHLKQFDEFTGFFTSTFNSELNLHDDILNVLLHEIKIGINNYIKNITKPTKPLPSNILFGQTWLNCYESGQHQEPHNHLGFGCTSPFSFIYYLKLCGDTTDQTVFLNNGYDTCQFFYSNNLNVVDPLFSPAVCEGQYIIFPSFLSHYVDHHFIKNENRITVAGNFELEYEDDQK